MAASNKANRMRIPVMSAFRSAFTNHDAQKRVDERDESGERVIAGRRATGRSALSETALQQSVPADLQPPKNTTNLDATVDLDDFAEVKRSILNFGMPDMVHRSIDEVRIEEVGGELVEALITYEPRLVRGTIRAERDKRVDGSDLRVRFVVRADLNCDPLNLPVEFVAEVERNTGQISISTR